MVVVAAAAAGSDKTLANIALLCTFYLTKLIDHFSNDNKTSINSIGLLSG